MANDADNVAKIAGWLSGFDTEKQDPGQVKSGARMNTLSVAMGDYKALWSRCQKAEAERDGWREEFQKQVETTEARLEAAEELAGAVAEAARQKIAGWLEDALAAFRKDQEESK